MSEFIKNTWYVAAWSSELQANTLLDRIIAGEHLVLYKTTSGRAVALQNRCCHRSAPLSLGAREGDGIRCGYHGMKFDAAGRCIEIPGQTMIPPQACVRAYPVIERQGWVWVWTGDACLADASQVATLKHMGDTEWAMETDYLKYDTNYQLIHDNLLDFSHISYVHAGTFGGGNTKWSDQVPELRRTGNGFEFERWMTDVPPAPFIKGILPDGVRHDILNKYEFHMPGILGVDTSVQLAGTGTRENMSNEGFLRSFSWQAVTPEMEHSTHYFFSTALPRSMPAQILGIMHGGTKRAFEEDRRMIGAQQEILENDQLGSPISLVATAHDGPMLQMRKMITKRINLEKTKPQIDKI